jgi:hypothetical protein
MDNPDPSINDLELKDPATLTDEEIDIIISRADDLNLYQGLNFVNGEGGIITLHNTYEYSTLECALRFLARKWFDLTFLLLIDGIMADGNLRRTEAIAPYALTNFIERQLVERTDPVYKKDRQGEAYARRLEKLKPKANLILGNSTDESAWSKKAEKISLKAGVPAILARHPTLPPDGKIIKTHHQHMTAIMEKCLEFQKRLKNVP